MILSIVVKGTSSGARRFRSGTVAILSLFLFTACDPLQATWSIDGSTVPITRFEMPIEDGLAPVIEALQYDITRHQILIKTRLYPADSLPTVSNVENAEIAWFAADAEGLVRLEQPPDSLFSLEPSAGLLLSSSLLRSIGDQQYSQPFGTHRIETRIDEEAYEVTRTGLLFSGNYTETLGDGTVRMTLRSRAGTAMFVIEESYTENSGEYIAYFSPDGRYLLLLLPNDPDNVAAKLPGHHRFLVVGPLEVAVSSHGITAKILTNAQAKRLRENERERRRMYDDGDLSPADYFGKAYVDAEQRLRRCPAVREAIGEIRTLKLQGRVLDFGNPNQVGKVFSFAYATDVGSGVLQIISLEPEHRLSYGEQYRAYVEGIDIRDAKGVTYVTCPVGSAG